MVELFPRELLYLIEVPMNFTPPPIKRGLTKIEADEMSAKAVTEGWRTQIIGCEPHYFDVLLFSDDETAAVADVAKYPGPPKHKHEEPAQLFNRRGPGGTH